MPNVSSSTPGEIAYAAFDAAYPADRFVRLTWDEQAPAVKAAWEAAAQAAIDHATVRDDEEEPPYVFIA